MMKVTDTAAQRLNQLLDQTQVPDGACLRISAAPNGLKMSLDEPRDDDQQFRYDGELVFVVDSDTAGLYQDRTLDYETEGAALVIR